jgi:hypothetical protein
MRRRRLIAVSLAAAMLSGAALASFPAAAVVADRWGCNAARTAVDYRPGAAHAVADHRYVVCRYDTGAPAAEPSFVFDRTGAMLYQNWIFKSTPSGEPARVRVRKASPPYNKWSDVSPNGGNTHQTTLDPILNRDDYTSRIFSLDFGYGTCSVLSYTDNNGKSWTRVPRLSCLGFDGESIGAGPPVTSHPMGYKDVVYYCTGTTLGSSPPTTTPICSKSIDGGLTFVYTGALPFPLTGQNDVFAPWAGNPVVAPDGTLYLPKRSAGQPAIAISRTEGASWTDVTVAHDGSGGEATRVAVSKNGTLAYTWVEATHHHVMLAVSHDHAKTWSTPVDLTPPGVREAALPRVDLSPDASTIAVAYLASTNAPGHAPFYADCSVFLSECDDGVYAHATWNGYLSTVTGSPSSHSVVHTTTMNVDTHPLFTGGCSADGACKAVFDFVDVHFHGGDAYAAFVDDCALRRPFTPVFNAGAGRCEDGYGEGVVLRMHAV